MKIKFGGSGDVSTKKLEGAIESILRARTARTALTIDSNFVICLIREVLAKREPTPYVSEFILDSKSGSKSDIIEAEAGEEEEEEEVELRRPVAPKKKKGLGLVKYSSNKYWLDSWGARAGVGVSLFILIAIAFLTLL